MRYPKLRELKEAIKALIKGPYTSRYPHKPHEPFERFRGRPYFYEDKCIGCTACAQVCPTGAIKFEDVGGKRVLTVHWDVCIFCGQCQANCLTQEGIKLSREFDFATTEKREDLKYTIEKDLIFCDCCKEVIAPFDQIAWVAKRLGPLMFANASLILFYMENLQLASKDIPPHKDDMELRRQDRIRVLCPRCRRESVIKS